MSELTLTVFGQTLLGSAILMFLVQKLKGWLKVQGVLVTILVYISGALLGVIGWFLGIWVPPANVPLTIWTAVVQGLISALLATGWYSFLSKKKEEV